MSMKENGQKVPRLLALGFFDGLHSGHAALLSAARAEAEARGLTPLALTFDTHPAAVLGGEGPLLLSTPEDRAYLSRTLCGVEMESMPFDRALAELSPEAYADLLCARYGARALCTGESFTFGRGAAGNARTLAELCQSRGLACFCVPTVHYEGLAVSSTRIRAAVTAGQMELAQAMLGHPYMLSGTVVSGCGLGRKLGYPTANLSTAPNVALPAPGVYVTRACTPQGEFAAVTSVGPRPTVDKSPRITVETHVIDRREELYGECVRVLFLSRLRGIRTFAGRGQLREQIARDVAAAREHAAGGTPEGRAIP